ncbi:MAG: MMPL family transporter [bacterium]|nr:MMPL family transporter [bacterium]
MRNRIEVLLEHLGHLVFRNAWGVLGGILLLVALGATQIPKIELRTSMDEFLRADDPIRAEYDAFLERFGRDDMILIAIEPPEVFEFSFLLKLRDLHEALENDVPHLREVRSLINARETRGEDEQLIVGELFDDWPETGAQLAAIRARALANPLYTDMILTRNADLTTMTIELEAFSEFFESDDAFSGFEEYGAEASNPEASREPTKLTGSQEADAVSALKDILARFEAPDFRIYAGGAPVLNTALMLSLVTDIVLFTVLSTVMIGLFLTFVFRRVLAVVVPLLIAIVSLVATLATMGTFEIPAMPISEIVPSFLLSIGIGATVHLIAIFLQRIGTGASREDAIAGALGHSGLPIIMTSLTTAGGIASFASADLVPIAVFGIVAPLGILLTLFMTLLLGPALLAVMPLRALPPLASPDLSRPAVPSALSTRMLTRLGDYSTSHAGRILGASAALVVIALVGMLRLQVSFDSLEWFPEDLPAKVAARKLDEKFGGSIALELLFDSATPNGLHEPEVLQAVDRARHTATSLQVGAIIAGQSISIVDIVKEIHQALNEGRPEARIIPDDRALLAQELILFENAGSDDLEDVVDSEFSLGRFSIRTPMVDASHYPPFGDEVQRIFAKELDGLANISLTGMMVVMGRTLAASIETMFRSYTIALAVITPLMMLLLGSIRLGLLAMIPNLFPIVLTLGLMGWLDIPLEMFSLLIGSVALGLAVDDTIHFMHGFRRGYAATGSVEIAVRETLQTTGQALLFTSIVLTMGFLIYALSDLSNLSRFGLLTAFSVVSAFLADVLLAPALMKVMARFSSLGVEHSRSAE